MLLTADQLATFNNDGVIALPNLFSQDEVDAITARLPRLFAERCPENFRERSSDVVRTAMGLHLRDELFARLVRDPRFVEPAQQILGDDDLYVMQVKVNAKEAFTGEQWQWHYDFATHHREDGVPEPLALNMHIFLDEVTEFNGPLIFIPQSHRDGPPADRARHHHHQLPAVDRRARSRASRSPSAAGCTARRDRPARC